MKTPALPRTRLLAMTACVLVAPTAWSAWPDTTWQLNQSKSRFECAFCTQGDEEYKTSYHSALRTMDQWVSNELQAISQWMSAMGFMAPALPATPGPYYVYPERNRSEAVQEILAGRLASYHPDDGIELNYESFIAPLKAGGRYDDDSARDNAVTLAHEVYHGVQASLDTMETEQPNWHSEGMPEAVGRAWEKKRNGDVYFARSDYSQPLHKPEDIYSRAHFFYMLGKDLGSSPHVAYFKDLDQPAFKDGHDGLNWIDTFLTGRLAPLADYYPRFIAAHAITAHYFSEDDEQRYQAGEFSPATDVTPDQDTDVQIDAQPRSIQPIAAHYTPASPGFSGAWDEIDDADRIYANLLSIHEADRIADSRLIIDRSLIPQGERYADLVYAAAGRFDPPLHVRITNVAQTPTESKTQQVRLRMESARVTIGLPSCMRPGQTEPVHIDGPLTDAEKSRLFLDGASRIQVSAGKILPDLSYTAPTASQTVRVSLNVPTLDNRSKRIQLPPIKVHDKGCMIRLKMAGLTITHDPAKDYVEFKAADMPHTLYLKGNDVAIHDGSWQAMPPMVKDLMLNSMRTGVAQSMAALPPTMRDDFHMHNMPRVFSQRFSWNTVRQATGPDGKPARRQASACPGQDTGCTKTTIMSGGTPMELIFHSDGSPARVMIPGAPFDFEYGGFNIGLPPGW